MDELLNKLEKTCYTDDYEKTISLLPILIDKLETMLINDPFLKLLIDCIMYGIENKDVIYIGDCITYGLKKWMQGENINIDIFLNSQINYCSFQESIYYLPTFSTELSLCVKNNNESVIRLNSLFSPENEVKLWCDKIEGLCDSSIVCLFGIGTGLFAKEILRRLGHNSSLIIYEANTSLYDYCICSGSVDNSDEREQLIRERITNLRNDSRVIMYFDDNSDSFRKILFDYINLYNISKLVVTKHNAYDKVFPDKYLYFLKEINYCRRVIYTNKNTLEFYKDMYACNIFKNFRIFEKTIFASELNKVIPSSIPAIIVSAGPSLEKNVEVLKQAKGHLLILAVDTSLRYLLKKNIVPDISVTVDPLKPDTYYSDLKSCEIPCIFDIDANPLIINRLNGNRIVFTMGNMYIYNLMKKIGKNFPVYTSCGGSVATAAFELLTKIGVRKIILVGQDLAYKNGKTHVGSEDDGDRTEIMVVSGIDGSNVQTRRDWFDYINWFQDRINKLNKNGLEIEVIDATEGGAKIEGTKIMTLKDAIDSCRDIKGSLPLYKFDEQLKKIKSSLSAKDYFSLVEYNRGVVESLDEISVKATYGLGLCDALVKSINMGDVERNQINTIRSTIAKITDCLNKSLAFPIIHKYIMAELSEKTNKVNILNSEDMAEVNNHREMFFSVRKAAEHIKDMIAEYIGK